MEGLSGTRRCRSFNRWYEVYQRGVLEHSGAVSCRTDRNWVTFSGPVGLANPQVDLREMLDRDVWSNSPFNRLSTGAKHLHGERPEYLSACKRLTRFPVRLHNLLEPK